MNIMRIFKNILTATVLVIMAVGLSSCYFRLSDDAKKQFKYDLRYRISDSGGKIDTVTRNVGEFHSIDIGNDLILNTTILVQTKDEFKVEVIAYDYLIDSIHATNDNGVLRIYNGKYKSKIQGMTQVRVYAPMVSDITNRGGGSIRLSDYKGDSLNVETVGSGNLIAFNLKISGKLTIRGTGSGDHEFRHVTAGEMVIDKKGSGDGEYSNLNIGTLSVTSTGSGDATLSGKADSVTFHKSGSGDIDASELKAKSVKTQESGSGDLIVNDESINK